MRYLISFLIVFVACSSIWGQESSFLEGEVSFVSSRNVYIKFSSTEKITVGDTLFGELEGIMTPVLVVSNKSSTSVVTSVLESVETLFQKGQKIYYRVLVPINIEIEEEIPNTIPLTSPTNEIAPDEDQVLVDPSEKIPEGEISGRISAGSYSSFSDYRESHRFRYALIMRGEHLLEDKISFDGYITFRHAPDRWEDVKENLFNALKVYNLSIGYALNSTTHFSFGRRINRRFSNMGAVDGLQIEKNFGNFSLGAIVGSRPDYNNYGVNLNLFEYGAFAGFQKDRNLTTLAFVEQKNRAFTDRRFVFLQHSGNLTNNLFMLASFEVDLYQRINEKVDQSPHLTNFFVSANFTASKKIRFNASYDNRKNIIFYESYKSYIDQLIDEETRQGFRIGVHTRPFKQVSIGGNFNWRFQKSGQNDSKNANAFVTINRPWGKGSSLSARGTWLRTGYLESFLVGLRVRQTVIDGKIDTDAYIRRINYQYYLTGLTRAQYLMGLNLNFRLTRQLSLYLYGEGTYNESDQKLDKRINTRIIKRF